jgi:hypothetical protein
MSSCSKSYLDIIKEAQIQKRVPLGLLTVQRQGPQEGVQAVVGYNSLKDVQIFVYCL